MLRKPGKLAGKSEKKYKSAELSEFVFSNSDQSTNSLFHLVKQREKLKQINAVLF